MIKNTANTYGVVAKSFHWLLFLMLTFSIVAGNIMASMPKGAEKLEAAGMHKSFGAVILMLIMLRLVWRLMNETPQLPDETTAGEAFIAKAMHWGLYLLMFAQPLSGIMMSQAAGFPVSFFGFFEFPVFLDKNPELAKTFLSIHGTVWILLVISVVGHAGAALRHHFEANDYGCMIDQSRIFNQLKGRKMKRLLLLPIFIVGILFSSLTTAANFPTEEPMGGKPFGHSVKNMGNGLYVFRWWVYRNIFLVTDEGVIVTDPMNPKAANLLLSEIRKITDKPVKYVVYSHNHHDHISGGNVFKKQGAKFIAHKNVLKELADHPSAVTPLPDITFEDEYTVQLGGRTLELKYFGPNHGESLVVMRLPKEKILFIVDIVTPRRVAFRSMPDFWPDEWVRSLKEIEQMNFDYVISGHGPLNQPAIDPATVVAEQRIYLEDLMAAVKAELKKGTHSPDKLRQIVKLPKYKNWRYYNEWLPMNIERIWAYYHMGW